MQGGQDLFEGELVTIAEKIRKLIAHAEGTNSEEEATNYWSKAQELMARYAIDEAMVRRSKAVNTNIIERRIADVGIKDFRGAKIQLLHVVALRNRCKMIDMGNHSAVVGTDSDTRFVEMLYTSLMLEGWRCMLADRKKDPEGRARPNPYALNWLVAYTNRINSRLAEANRKAQEAAQSEAKEGTVAIVLRDHQQKVEEEFNKLYPFTKKGRTSRPRDWMEGAYSAGKAAGSNANLQPGVNPHPRELPG